MDLGYNYEEEVELLEEVDVVDDKNLVVFNDDVNTFDHVINTLVKVCRHTVEQAEVQSMLFYRKNL